MAGSEASPAALEAGREILEQLVGLMGYRATVTVVSGATARIVVHGADETEREALGALIGRKGERLSALQHLVNLMLSRKMGEWTRVLVDVEDYRGRPVILYFWTSACPTCRGELPHVNRLWAEYRAAGLEVLLVDFREPLDVVRRTASERRYAAPVLLDDTGDVTGRLYGVWGTPTVYVIDRAGRLIARGVGPRDWTTPAARRLIESLLVPR